MSKKSKFNEDLKQEQILNKYVDSIYDSLGMSFERITDMPSQYRGIDLILKDNNRDIFIDEKAQLHYLNKSLPTFAFELSYIKNNFLNMGWLFDARKATNIYFLITGIYLKNSKTILTCPNDIERLDIVAVQRQKLLEYLKSKNITIKTLREYQHDMRQNNKFRAYPIKELDEYKEGKLFFTEFLAEKPINLVLKIDNLIEQGIAIKIK